MNCREGDLALVIRGPDVGKTVTVLAAVKRRELIVTSLGEAAPISPFCLPAWHVDRDLSAWSLNSGQFTVRVAADEALMPIRPEADPEEIPAEREVTA